jgi:transposase-like protein
MAKAKIDPDALRSYLDAGHTQADAARHFGVSEPAIHQRLKKIRQLTSHVVALEKAGTLVEQKMTAVERLDRVQRVIDRELDFAVRKTEEPGADRAALADVILKLTAEIRQQLGLQLSISKALVDLRVVKEFQDTVIEILRDEAPETARRIIARLKERRALRPSAGLPTLDGDGGSDGFVA